MNFDINVKINILIYLNLLYFYIFFLRFFIYMRVFYGRELSIYREKNGKFYLLELERGWVGSIEFMSVEFFFMFRFCVFRIVGFLVWCVSLSFGFWFYRI